MNKLNFASITQIDIERAINKITLLIYSVKPGMIIGRGGKGLEEVKKLAKQHKPKVIFIGATAFSAFIFFLVSLADLSLK